MPTSKKELLETLNKWLSLLIEKKGTDLHIKSNAPIKARIGGDIQLLSKELMGTSASMIEGLVLSLIGTSKIETFKANKEFDSVYVLQNQYRFRYNIYKHHNGYAISFRLITYKIQTLESLNLPSALHKISKLSHGLVLITGVTGSGKSTTLTTILEEINRTSQRHIITIEDPIEYVFEDQSCIIEQREIGLDANSVGRALRAALREDPDIIVVGEIRDLDTAESILQAVNTGHLILSTTHTTDAKETIDRLIAIFPTNEQNRVRATLAETLEAIISQRLIKGRDNKMIPAVEMMFRSPFIQDLIRNKRDNEIVDAMEKEGNTFDSITFNQALYDLVLSEKITEDSAYQHATSPSDLKLMLSLSEEYNAKEEKY